MGREASRAVANQAVESLEYRQVDSGQTQEAPQGFCVEKRQAGPEGRFRRGFLYQSLFFFLNVYLLLRDGETQSVSRGGVERRGDTESEAGSRL